MLVGVALRSDELALGVHEVTLAVEVVLAEGFDADAVDGSDVIDVGHRGGRLFDFPDVLAQSAVRGRGVEDDLGAVQTQCAPALGEVAVVADVDAHRTDRGLEDRVSPVAGLEVELLEEALHLRDVLLAVLAQVGAVGIDDRGGVVVHAGLGDLVHGEHQHHAGFLGDALETLGGGAIGDVLGVAVVLGVLHLTEVRAVEQLLEAHDLSTLLGGLVHRGLVLVDHGVLGPGPIGLQQSGANGVL